MKHEKAVRLNSLNVAMTALAGISSSQYVAVSSDLAVICSA